MLSQLTTEYHALRDSPIRVTLDITSDKQGPEKANLHMEVQSIWVYTPTDFLLKTEPRLADINTSLYHLIPCDSHVQNSSASPNTSAAQRLGTRTSHLYQVQPLCCNRGCWTWISIEHFLYIHHRLPIGQDGFPTLRQLPGVPAPHYPGATNEQQHFNTHTSKNPLEFLCLLQGAGPPQKTKPQTRLPTKATSKLKRVKDKKQCHIDKYLTIAVPGLQATDPTQKPNMAKTKMHLKSQITKLHSKALHFSRTNTFETTSKKALVSLQRNKQT
jgi:hypothetical protein